MADPTRATPRSISYTPHIVLALVALLVVACFFPVTKYFFLQDDFMLIEKAAMRSGSVLSGLSGVEDGKFRPLTRFVYFISMYKIFGLNPLPYHVASLLIHIMNVFLLYVLLVRFELKRNTALILSTVFALHVGFLNAVAWISCIQQLVAELFVLLALNSGILAFRRKSTRLTVVTSALYVLALFSMEQSYAVPLLLFLYVYLEAGTEAGVSRTREAFRRTAPYLSILGIYILFMVAGREIPTEGPYALSLGSNVWSNLLIYLDWAFDLSVLMPFAAELRSPGLTVAHLFIIFLIVYGLARGRGRMVVFSLAYYVLTLLPVLFLQDHRFYYHNYVPFLGMLLLLSPLLDDLNRLLIERRTRVAGLCLVGFVGLVAFMSFTKVRANERNVITTAPLARDFVLRRAVVAKNVYDDIKQKRVRVPKGGKLYMVFKEEGSWFSTNAIAALGDGSALRLFYSDPKLEVFFSDRGDTLQYYHPADSQILFYDHLGHCFTIEEIEEREGSGLRRIE
jgi:hypothetical protein